MKKIYILIIVSVFSLVISSCDEEDLPKYNSGNYLYFLEDNESEYIYSFSLNPGVNEVNIPIEVNLIGNSSDKDREIKLSVIEDKTTAAASNYEMPSKIFFGANKYKDTLYIKIKNTDILKTEKKTLAVRLESNDNFGIGLETNREYTITMHDMLAKPNWWDDVVVSEYLGEYSNKKFTLLMQVTGVSSFEGENSTFKRNVSLQLKYYLIEQKDEGNEILEEDGNPMTLPIIG